MTADISDPPLTVTAAAHAEKEARGKVQKCLPRYSQLRGRLDTDATSLARTELGTAYGELITAIVALAEAMDRRGPEWAAAESRGWTLFKRSDSGHERCDQAWHDYQQARRGGDWTATAAARTVWRDALVTWHLEHHAQRVDEDDLKVEELRSRLGRSLQFDPDDAFPRPRSSADGLVQASRERERRESIHRDATRYQAGLKGWRPAGQ